MFLPKAVFKYATSEATIVKILTNKFQNKIDGFRVSLDTKNSPYTNKQKKAQISWICHTKPKNRPYENYLSSQN